MFTLKDIYNEKDRLRQYDIIYQTPIELAILILEKVFFSTMSAMTAPIQ